MAIYAVLDEHYIILAVPVEYYKIQVLGPSSRKFWSSKPGVESSPLCVCKVVILMHGKGWETLYSPQDGWVLCLAAQRPSLWDQDSHSPSCWESWPLATHSQWSLSPGTALQRPKGPASPKAMPISWSQPTSKDQSMGGGDYKGPTYLLQFGATLKWTLILTVNALELHGVGGIGSEVQRLGFKAVFAFCC